MVRSRFHSADVRDGRMVDGHTDGRGFAPRPSCRMVKVASRRGVPGLAAASVDGCRNDFICQKSPRPEPSRRYDLE